MKEKYIPAEIEIFNFKNKDVIHASSADTSTVENHDNNLLGYEDFL